MYLEKEAHWILVEENIGSCLEKDNTSVNAKEKIEINWISRWKRIAVL